MTTDPTSTPATPSPRAGRPRRLDDTKRSEICALVSAGCTVADAAHYVRCAVSTIHRERRLNQEFRTELRGAEQTAQLQPLRAMQKAVATHWRAAAWLLERTHPERFGKQSPPAFGPSQVRMLIGDIVAIIDEADINGFQRNRLKKRVVTAMRNATRVTGITRLMKGNFRRTTSLASQPEVDSIQRFAWPSQDSTAPSSPLGSALATFGPNSLSPADQRAQNAHESE